MSQNNQAAFTQQTNITFQKNIHPIDSMYHGIRLDAYVAEDNSGKISANVYDVEVEDRKADKAYFPKRLR